MAWRRVFSTFLYNLVVRISRSVFSGLMRGKCGVAYLLQPAADVYRRHQRRVKLSIHSDSISAPGGGGDARMGPATAILPIILHPMSFSAAHTSGLSCTSSTLTHRNEWVCMSRIVGPCGYKWVAALCGCSQLAFPNHLWMFRCLVGFEASPPPHSNSTEYKWRTPIPTRRVTVMINDPAAS